jgi:hypothetical protein
MLENKQKDASRRSLRKFKATQTSSPEAEYSTCAPTEESYPANGSDPDKQDQSNAIPADVPGSLLDVRARAWIILFYRELCGDISHMICTVT